MRTKRKVLVSSCLLGERVRYDGVVKKTDSLLRELFLRGEVIPVCPEVDGGLGVPRPPSEILSGEGEDVLEGRSRILNSVGEDVTEAFVRGAYRALQLCRQYRIKVAILKSKSPSCSREKIYDGSFSRRLKEGRGVTVALLEREGIVVFDETQIEAALLKAGIRF